MCVKWQLCRIRADSCATLARRRQEADRRERHAAGLYERVRDGADVRDVPV
jgi:hypothetical protein